jgi:hypothetical protein
MVVSTFFQRHPGLMLKALFGSHGLRAPFNDPAVGGVQEFSRIPCSGRATARDAPVAARAAAHAGADLANTQPERERIGRFNGHPHDCPGCEAAATVLTAQDRQFVGSIQAA